MPNHEMANRANIAVINEMRVAKKDIARVLTEIRKKEIESLAKECQDKEFKPIVIRNISVKEKNHFIGGKKTKAERLALTWAQKRGRSVHCSKC